MSKKERPLMVANYILKNNSSIRQAARALGLSKSTVHSDVSYKLQKLDFALFLKVKHVLYKNFYNKQLMIK